MSARSDPSYPGGFPAILRQMAGRLDPLQYGPGEALPPVDVDLAPFKSRTCQGPSPEIAVSRTSFARKVRDLWGEFDGRPELLALHGLLIANLRRRAQPPQTEALFLRLWAEEADWLLAHLDARWLVSAATTFGDHGATEAQRAVGQSLSVLFAMMKLYETERLYSGHRPETPFDASRRAARRLPLEMDPYALDGGGLDVNMLGRLWTDAGADPVIQPLARHLLELLITDQGGVFRRLRLMRKARAETRSDTGLRSKPARDEMAPVAAPVPQQGAGAADTTSWGTVTLTNAPLHRIARFAAHHLDLGAARVHLFLDAADPQAVAYLSRHPAVSVTVCDDGWWMTQKKPRMKAHQMRQAWVASQCYKQSGEAWLAHIDVDEFLLPDGPLSAHLAAVPADMAALLVPPVELLAGSAPALFKMTPRMAGQDKSVLATLYPTFGSHLRGGYVSHLEGKLITRTGIAGLRLGLHGLTHEGAPVENRHRAKGLHLGHAHAPDWETFRAHLDFRMNRGSYRKTNEAQFKLRDVLAYLQEAEGEAGLRAFYDEVCTARPDLVAALAAHGMLLTYPLDLDAAVIRQFGALPPKVAR